MGKITLNLAAAGLVPRGEHQIEVRRVTLHDKIDGTSQYLRLDLAVIGGEADGQSFDRRSAVRRHFSGFRHLNRARKLGFARPESRFL